MSFDILHFFLIFKFLSRKLDVIKKKLLGIKIRQIFFFGFEKLMVDIYKYYSSIYFVTNKSLFRSSKGDK